MTVLHLIRPESGPWDGNIAARQARQGDQVVVLRWRDGTDERVACEVIASHGVQQSTPGTTVSYRQLLDLLFNSDQVYYW